MNFFEELKRRNVYRVATAYVVVAWVLVQAADTLFPIFEFPDQALRTFTVLLFLGFPLVLVLSWMFEFTAQGLRRTSAADNESVPLGGNDYAVTLLLVVLVGFMAVQQFADAPLPEATITTAAQVNAPPVNSQDVSRTTIDIGPVDRRAVSQIYTDLAISSDGRTLFYTTWDEATRSSRIYSRQMDSLSAVLLDETIGETLISPTPSPSGERLLYETEGSRMLLDLVGGISRPYNEIRSGLSWGFDWTSETSIVFAGEEGNTLFRYSEDAAAPQLIEGFESAIGSIIHAPQLLPGGEWLLLSSARVDGSNVMLFNLQTTETQEILENAFAAKYVASGHIVFLRMNDLWAVPFDLGTAELNGRPTKIVSGIDSNQFYGRASYDVSDTGTLVYMPGRNQIEIDMQLSWYDVVSGDKQALELNSGFYNHIRLSPDEREVALRVDDEDGNGDIWIYSIPNKTFRRLTFIDTARAPVWSNSGEQIVYASNQSPRAVWMQNSDGSGQPQLLLEIEENTRLFPWSFTPDDSHITLNIGGKAFLLSTDGSGSLESLDLVDNAYTTSGARISPDGAWIAYRSNQAGGGLFVSPYPDISGGRWQITDETVWQLDWGRERSELYYRTVGIHSTIISNADGFTATPPRELMDRIPDGLNENPRFDINRAGDRFLFIEYADEVDVAAEDEEGDVELVVVSNWFAELNRLAPRNQL